MSVILTAHSGVGSVLERGHSQKHAKGFLKEVINRGLNMQIYGACKRKGLVSSDQDELQSIAHKKKEAANT